MSTSTTSPLPILHTPGVPARLHRLRFFSAPADASAGGAAGTGGTDAGATGDGGDAGKSDPKPTETVEFWKAKAREQERRAKDNAAAATELQQIKDAAKTDAQKQADALAEANTRAEKAEREKTALSIAVEHKLSADDAELVAGMPDEDAMRALAKRLEAAADAQSTKGPVTPKAGTDNNPPKPDEDRQFVRALFGRDE